MFQKSMDTAKQKPWLPEADELETHVTAIGPSTSPSTKAEMESKPWVSPRIGLGKLWSFVVGTTLQASACGLGFCLGSEDAHLLRDHSFRLSATGLCFVVCLLDLITEIASQKHDPPGRSNESMWLIQVFIGMLMVGFVVSMIPMVDYRPDSAEGVVMTLVTLLPLLLAFPYLLRIGAWSFSAGLWGYCIIVVACLTFNTGHSRVFLAPLMQIVILE